MFPMKSVMLFSIELLLWIAIIKATRSFMTCSRHHIYFDIHPKALTTTSCTSFDKPLASTTFCNAAQICFCSAGWKLF